jgi:hypothetical protein
MKNIFGSLIKVLLIVILVVITVMVTKKIEPKPKTVEIKIDNEQHTK